MELVEELTSEEFAYIVSLTSNQDDSSEHIPKLNRGRLNEFRSHTSTSYEL